MEIQKQQKGHYLVEFGPFWLPPLLPPPPKAESSSRRGKFS